MCFFCSSTQGFAMLKEHDPRESLCNVHHDSALLDLDTLIPGTLLSVLSWDIDFTVCNREGELIIYKDALADGLSC